MRDKVEKFIGDLLDVEAFKNEVLAVEGYDSLVLLWSSSTDEAQQNKFIDSFIDLKKRFKRQRTRSMRFHSVDVNTDFKIS